MKPRSPAGRLSERMRLPVLACLVALAPGGAQTGTETEQPTFSLDVKVVNVLATVKDRSGRLITTLDKDDFILEEDGVRQNIQYFAHQADLPLNIGLLVDTSGSQKYLIPEERSAASQFFRSVLRPKTDLAFLMSFDRNVELLQDYTDSQRLLERGLQELHVEVPLAGLHPNPTGQKPQTSTALHDAIFLAADEMFRSQVGRKAIVLISDGYDYGSKVDLNEAVEAAQRADVVIFSIRYADLRAGVGLGTSSLKKLSEKTGGTLFRVSRRRGLPAIFQQIEDEMRSQYSLGYTPQRALTGAGFRKITLKSPRKGLRIQARDGYFADAI